MKVLHLLKTSDGAVWAFRQIRELKQLGAEVHVMLPEKGKMSHHYDELGIPVTYFNTDVASRKSPLKLYHALREFRGLVSSMAPDIIHSHFVGTTLFSRLAFGGDGGPIRIFQIPGPLHLEHSLTRRAELMTAGVKDYWIASCNLSREILLKSGIQTSRIGHSFYGTDTHLFSAEGSGRLHTVLGKHLKAPIVGMVAYAYKPKAWLGQRRGIKGHEDLIDAVKLLRNEGRDVFLVLVGGAWVGAERYYEQIKAYAAQVLGEGYVFLGTRNDVAALYPDFDVVVHPSHSENLGGAVESMLAGVPTIASNTGGFPDIVHDGVTGWLFKARSPQDLAQKLGEVLSNPAHSRMVAHVGRKHVLERLAVQRTASEVWDCYRNWTGIT